MPSWVRQHVGFLMTKLCRNSTFTDGHRYQFGQAFGGIVFPPYSEAFGRKSVYISSSLVYCIACAIVGFVPSISGAFVGRFISGFVSAVPSIVVSGSIEDMFDMQQRVWMIFIWACATTGGLLLGPVYGTYISYSLGWYVLPFQLPNYC